MTRTAMRKDADSGSTLVEVMIAVVILLTIALAGGAFLMHSRSQLSTQRSKRIILEAVNARLENIRATGYTAIANLLPQNGSTHFLSLQGANFVYSASDPGETVSINNLPYAMVTTAQFVDVDAGTPSLDYLFVRVSAVYMGNSTDAVTLETNFGP